MYTFQKICFFSGILFVIASLLFFPSVISLIGPLAIGGVITGGILGGFSGKVGSVVGGKWKTTNYMRGHVIPANPKSDGQKAQRGAMSQMVLISQQILSVIIQTYWNPFQSTMSGYNAFVKENIARLAAFTFDVNGDPVAGSGYLDETLVLSKGSLNGVPSITAVYTTLTGDLTVTWADNSGEGNALATDAFIISVFHEDGTLLGTQESTVTPATRTDGTDSLTIATGKTATELYAFITFHRGTGASLLVSNSVGDNAAAA